MSVHRFAGDTTGAVAFCAALQAHRVSRMRPGQPARAARMLDAAGVGCVVAPPGKIERPAQDPVKTGRRDGERVARLLMMRHAEKHAPMTSPASNQTNARARTSLPATTPALC